MTMRERILALIRGERPDRAPCLQYDDLVAPNAEVWAAVGRENVGIVRWSRVHRLVAPNCRTVTRERIEDGWGTR